MTVRAKSVIEGKDWDVIPVLLDIHAISNPAILDVTFNRGVMWKGIRRGYPGLRTMDIDPSFNTDYVGDFRDMPVLDASFDVIVFDPPHLPVAAASSGSSKMWETRYGITAAREKADNVSANFLPFLLEAKRVLRQGGIVLAKIADIVHNHRYQWQHVDFIVAARTTRMTPCDLVVKLDPLAGRLQSSKWMGVRHVRKAHCFWIVVRNSDKCELIRRPLSLLAEHEAPCQKIENILPFDLRAIKHA